MKLSFDAWMEKVNRQLESMCGLSSDDLPDYCYADAYEGGQSPRSVAKVIIEGE